MAPSNANVPTPVPFPQPDSINPPSQPATGNSGTKSRSRTSTNASIASTASRLRTASLKFMDASPPAGMWAATGSAASKAPTLAEIRRGSFSTAGWNEGSQRHRAGTTSSQGSEGSKRGPLPRTGSNQSATTPDSPGWPLGKKTGAATAPGGTPEPFPAVTEEDMGTVPMLEKAPPKSSHGIAEKMVVEGSPQPDGGEGQYPNGYLPPPEIPWTTSTVIGLKAFWKWFLTPSGFLITVYGLNVVAWGGMLFLLLCNAAPAMCHPSCDDLYSARRIWIEIDSQILNALFCVTGFGLAPWRFRDLYWWGWWRLGGSKRKATGIRRLAGIHRGWFRLPGSDALPEAASKTTVSPDDPAVPIPVDKMPDAPPTGVHAPPTKPWKMDFVVWMNMWNTFFQIVLCFYMWHYNRFKRPSWATGVFVALGCIVAGLGGIMMFHEGKRVKRVEGVPVPKGYEDRPVDVEGQVVVVQQAPDAAPRA